MRLCLFLIVLTFWGACKNGENRSNDIKEKSLPKFDLMYLGINDFTTCFKYICIDSSGFYYLYCDTLINDNGVKKRIGLDKYIKEKEFLLTLDTSEFNSDYVEKGDHCGLGKYSVTVYVEIGKKPYQFNLLNISNCDSGSKYYKQVLINNFFAKLDKEYPSIP